jgi:M6 family metalloprotease-like protein
VNNVIRPRSYFLLSLRSQLLKRVNAALFLVLATALSALASHRQLPLLVATSGNEWTGGKADVSQSWAQGDTINILAIRVEFVQDDLPTTTGTGKFATGFPDPMIVDPLPHDRQYFEDHLLFVQNYYQEVSNHQVNFGRMDVFPADDHTPYQLPKFMWQYNYNYTTEVLDRQLAELFYDAWTAADSAGLFDVIDVNDYNAFVIFHAGVGKDFAFGFDPTPFDIPSAYLDLQHLRNNLTVPPEGIEVTGGHVPDGLILPESEVQEGYDLGMNGVVVKLFGNMMGIPDLFDTRNGRSGIGRWGMMDQGSGNYQALIPARPCPWTMYDQGWIHPVDIHPGVPDTFTVASITVSDITIPKYCRVALNDHEYFLIENRQANIGGGDFVRGYDRDGREMRFYNDYHIEAEPGFRVIVRVDDYDFDIPGSGILIWHIDESIIEAHRADNTVNASQPAHGVYVEEADGSQDIGQEYGILNAGYGQEYGSPWDCFFDDNEAHLESNHSIQVRFTDYTAPWARSNSGALSHLAFTQFSPIDTVMSFVLVRGLNQPGFPVSLEYGISPNSELLVDLTGDGINEIVAMDEHGRLLAFRGDGTGLGNTGNGILTEVTPSDAGGFRTAASDLNGDGSPEIVITNPDSTWIFTEVDSSDFQLLNGWNSGGMVLIGGVAGDRLIFVASGSDVIVGDSEGISRWRISYPDGLIQGMALYPDPDSTTIVVVFDQGMIKALRYNEDVPPFGTELWRYELPVNLTDISVPVTGDLKGNGGSEAIVASEHGFFVVDSLGFSGPFPSDLSVNLTSQPTLADLDQDGTLEIVMGGQGAIYAFHYNGTLVSEFPIDYVGWLREDPVRSSVLIADLAGDGHLDLLVANSLGDLVAFDTFGHRLDDFPLSADATDGRSPVIGQIDSDPGMEVAVGSSAGTLHGWNLASAELTSGWQMSWPIWGYNNARTNQAPTSPYQPSSSAGAPPSNWTYCWPNPTEGDQSFIRIALNYSADLKIRIFDLAGSLVDELHGQVNPLAPVDVSWHLNSVQSGVYFARVQATGVGRSDMKILKIAVVK